jgi:hypothetical protein
MGWMTACFRGVTWTPSSEWRTNIAAATVRLALLVAAAACGGGVQNADAGSDSGEANADSPSMGQCTIKASAYDLSCSMDSDCVASVGRFALDFTIVDYCVPACLCGMSAINRKSAEQYLADISRTPLGSGAPTLCLCADNSSGPCCRAGICSVDCSGTTPRDSGQVAAGGDGSVTIGNTLCSLHDGPVDGAAGDAGDAIWCSASQQCLMYNGGWACCIMAGGIAACNQ